MTTANELRARICALSRGADASLEFQETLEAWERAVRREAVGPAYDLASDLFVIGLRMHDTAESVALALYKALKQERDR